MLAQTLIAVIFFSLNASASGCPCEDEALVKFKSAPAEKEFALARCRLKAPPKSACSNRPGAYKAIEKLAQEGHAKSEYLLGWWYLMGREDQKKDETKAFTYLERAAAKDIAPAQHELGQIYENGMGRPVDFGKARDWYKQAEKNGDRRAVLSLKRIKLRELEAKEKK